MTGRDPSMSWWLGAAICAVVATASALLAHAGRSAYHDGLRPLMPEYRAGTLERRALGGRIWRMSAPFCFFYALPFSLVSGVLVSHLLFLPADVLGVRLARRTTVGVAAALSGALAFLIVRGASALVGHLPVDFRPDLGRLVDTVGLLIGVMPVVAIAYQYGLRWAAATLVPVLALRAVAASALDGDTWLGLSPDGLALVAGGLVMLALAVRKRSREKSDAAELFADSMAQLPRGLPLLLLVGGLAAWLGQAGLLAGEPVAALLLGGGRFGDAAAVALLVTVGFFPLVVQSSVVSGAYSTQGYPDWILAAGYISPGPAVAVAGGSALMALEVLGVRGWLTVLERYPDLRELGAAVRQSITTVTDVGTLVGGLLAAQAIWPEGGALMAVAAYLLNEVAGRPLMRMAVGPLAALAAGIVVNVIAWI
jgi:hypothetical protein